MTICISETDMNQHKITSHHLRGIIPETKIHVIGLIAPRVVDPADVNIVVDLAGMTILVMGDVGYVEEKGNVSDVTERVDSITNIY